MSSDAKDLVRQMLTVDTENRISATDALQHGWIVADESTLGNTDLTANQDILKGFKPKAKLRQVVKLVRGFFDYTFVDDSKLSLIPVCFLFR